jgi:4-hydroxy-tetrahydrodipicolinate reductase
MVTRLFLSGCLGRMGRVIDSIAAGFAELKIVAGSDLIDGTASYPVYQDPRQCREDFDVLVDFSNVSALPVLFEFIRQRRCPAVICTTGLDPELQRLLEDTARSAAVFQSANMSLGVNLLISLARHAARILYPEFDIEILEAHHNQKLDAPSGTALLIANAINESLDGQMAFVNDRSQVRRKRQTTDIGISSIRGGSIVGEHTVIFAGQDEVLSLRHSAGSRAIFARGALAAARFMSGKQPGLYGMADLVGEA